MNNPVYTDFVHTSQANGRTSIKQKNWRMLRVRVFARLTQNMHIDSTGKIQTF